MHLDQVHFKTPPASRFVFNLLFSGHPHPATVGREEGLLPALRGHGEWCSGRSWLLGESSWSSSEGKNGMVP